VIEEVDWTADLMDRFPRESDLPAFEMLLLPGQVAAEQVVGG
jgi:hypothetical protein